MVSDTESGVSNTVIVYNISQICGSVRDLDRTASRLKDAGVELHIISEALTLRSGDDDPYQTALFQVLGVFAELQATLAQQRTREGIAARMETDEYRHGPAPLGFEKDDGRLIEAANYDRVVQVLEMKQKGEMGTREAARELDCGKATVNRALERGELYGI